MAGEGRSRSRGGVRHMSEGGIQTARSSIALSSSRRRFAGWLVGRISMLVSIVLAVSIGVTAFAESAGASASHAKKSSLYKLLPASIRSSGTIVQYTTDIFPPMAMATKTGSGLTGVDPELAQAMAKVIGVKLVSHAVTTFSELFPAITTGRADLEFTATFDSSTRYKLDTFVDYFRTGTQLYIPKSEASTYRTVSKLCGHTIAGETGTLYQTNLTAAFKKICKNGTGLTFVNVPGISEQNTELQEGRAQAAVAGPESVDYLQKTNPNQYERIGPTFYPTYYGVTLPNSAFGKQLRHVVQLALDKMIKNGTYIKILKRFNVQRQAVKRATIDKGTYQP